MEQIDDRLVVSPTDLVGHLACRHLTVLDLGAARAGGGRPVGDDAELGVVQARGLEHEHEYLERLRAEGLTITEIAEPDVAAGGRRAALREREAETVAAMAAGDDVVFQATFVDETAPVAWRGHADFLRRVALPAGDGAFAYEPEDTKLARSVKPSAVLQLCEYAHQVARVQGREPEKIHVVLGGQRRVTLRLVEVAAYYRASRRRFVAALDQAADTYPLPVAHCAVCRWADACAQRRAADDHLTEVALLTREQARKLETAGVATMGELAAGADEGRVAGIGAATLSRLRRQARLQVSAPPGGPPPYEVLVPGAPGEGLAGLPAPDPGDLFYDIEGDPYVGDAGLEYLHGLGSLHTGAFSFDAWWAHDATAEKEAFEQVIDTIVEQRAEHPRMHVYHYAPYETAALGKLMGRYGTREAELDQLLRDGVFVDLYRIVRQGVAVGSPSYSIKDLEPLYMGERSGEVTDAGSSIVEYERWLGGGGDEILNAIEDYNRDDVESTHLLRDWLEHRRDELVADGVAVDRPDYERDEDEAKAEQRAADREERAALARRLHDDDQIPAPDDVERHARWLLGHLLFWHEREAKPEWWRYFDRVLRCDDDDLLADTEAIAGLVPVGDPEPIKRSYLWTYAFDAGQEFKLRPGSVKDPATERQNLLDDAQIPTCGTLHAIDGQAGRLQLKRGQASSAPHPAALIPSGPLAADAAEWALARLGETVLVAGLDGDGPAAAGRQLLGRRLPRIGGQVPGDPLRRPTEDGLDAALRLARTLDGSYLAIQGPPGSGKTYAAARIVTALLADGQTVGITANSHAVITNLLDEVAAAAVEEGVDLRAIQKPGSDGVGADHEGIEIVTDNGAIEEAVADGTVNVIAGTAWLMARENLQGALDTLVVDEAGQLSLANTLAVSMATENLVLVGDPQQLAQPSKGSHPPGADASALDHLLGGAVTMPDDRGLFLDHTRRMHPGVCTFISEQVYEGRLEAIEACVGQTVADGPVVGGHGLRWAPVPHQGNRTSSVEEAEELARVFAGLIGREWTDADGDTAPLTVDDLLVVAPYNAQVRLLQETLPHGARVGTVDKFQGQEGAVVLVSLGASSADEVPRGMEFLYSRHRLNVAVSRARALCVLVASPELLTVECRTVEQMRLANLLCRYVELAEPVR